MEKSKKPHRYKKRIISGFATLILLLAVVACLYIMLQSLSNGYVRCGRTSLFRVVTGSMEPTISTGAVLTAKESAIDTIEEGDIICFRSTNPGSEGVIVTHRVVEIDPVNRHFYTKGDANDTADAAPVHFNNVVGVPQFSIPLLGYVSDYIQHPPGLYVAIALGIGLLAVVFLPDLFQKKNKEEA